MSLNPPPRSTDRPSGALNPLRSITADNPYAKAVQNMNPNMPRPDTGNGLADGLAQAANAFANVANQKHAEAARQRTALQASRDDLTAANISLRYNTETKVLKQQIQAEFPNNPEKWSEEFNARAPEMAVKSVEDIPDEILRNKVLKGLTISQISEGDSLLAKAEVQVNKKIEAETQVSMQGASQAMALSETPDEVFRGALAIQAHGAEIANRLGNPDIAAKSREEAAQGIINALSGWARDEAKAETLLKMIEGKVTFKTGVKNEDGTEQEVRITDFIDASRLNALYNAGQQDIRQAKTLQQAEDTRQHTINTIEADADLASRLIAGTAGGVQIEEAIDSAKQDPNTTPSRVKQLENLRLAHEARQQAEVEEAGEKAVKAAEKAFKERQAKSVAMVKKLTAPESLQKNVILQKAIKGKDWKTVYEVYTNAASEVAVAQALGGLNDNQAAYYMGRIKSSMVSQFTRGTAVTKATKISNPWGKPLELEAKYLQAWVALQAPGGKGILENTAGEAYRAMQTKMKAGKPMTEAQIESFFRGRLRDRLSGRVK